MMCDNVKALADIKYLVRARTVEEPKDYLIRPEKKWPKEYVIRNGKRYVDVTHEIIDIGG